MNGMRAAQRLPSTVQERTSNGLGKREQRVDRVGWRPAVAFREVECPAGPVHSASLIMAGNARK